ncbi:MAG TPA: AAA family ATPase, partial [Methylomirabilota bacterium]|nr:AAA family ATPase [Methylomirabilota bacterium]
MLKLKKVEIVGFKSFCERTSVTFSGSGITCIVGPNGCGKSNVVDAVSWVLGEQSHKSLRAERMADCIFNGTTKRPPLGLAEVTITLEDPELAEAARFVLEDQPAEAEAAPETMVSADAPGSAPAESTDAEADPAPAADESAEKPRRRRKSQDQHALATRPGEVVVSRRLYRSGQSEYLINGRVGRLRDIQEMFMGVGLGPDSYAIIEQGRIGLILSSKPMERRAIIEEAAGVTKFKTKKRLAEARLESSRLNLARVNDIIVEVEKQVGSLKRQASKARRYAEIREQMRGIVRQMLASRARELDAEAESLAARLDDFSRKEAESASALTRQEHEHDRLSQRIYDLDAEIRRGQNHLGLTALELDRAENRLAFNRQRGEELALRGRQVAAEGEQAAAQTAVWRSRAAAHQESLGALEKEAAAQASRVEEVSAQAEAAADAAARAEQRIETLRAAAASAGEDLMRLHGEQRQAEEALLHHGESLRRSEGEESRLLESSMRIRDDAESAAMELESVASRLKHLQQQAAAQELRLAALAEQRVAAQAEADSLRDALAAARARSQTLARILNDHSYTAEAVKKLFATSQGAGQAGSRDFRAVGVLADYAEVEERYEAALEQFLRDELEYVVVETFDHARAGISLLRDEVGGRATFFVDSLGSLRTGDYEPIVPFRPDQGVVSRLDKLVEFRVPLGPAAKQFLPRLRSAFLTDSAAAAEKLAREYPQYAFVLPDGTCYQGRTVTGGRPDEAGPLGMKRELRSLETELVELERKDAATQASLEQLAAELRGADQALEALSGQQHECEREVYKATHRYELTQGELARLSLDLTVCQEELNRVRREVEAARRRAAQAAEQHAIAVAGRAAAESETARLSEGLIGMRAAIQAAQENLAAARAEQAAMSERLAAAQSLAARLAEEGAEFQRREAVLREEASGIESEAAELARQSEEIQIQLHGLRVEKARIESLQKQLEQEWESARTRVVET